MSDISGCNRDTETAYKSLDRRWGNEKGRWDRIVSEKDVRLLLGELKKKKTKNVLDLGCGLGRHALLLASQGFSVFAVDASYEALELTEKAAAEAGFAVDVQYSLMTELPYEDGFFDYVLAWNVVYHGTPDIVKKSVSEIKRVVRTGGIFQCTMLSKRNSFYGTGRRIDADTYITEIDDNEQRHPHFYCNAEELVDLFRGFEIVSLRLCEQKRPGSFYWNIVMERC